LPDRATLRKQELEIIKQICQICAKSIIDLNESFGSTNLHLLYIPDNGGDVKKITPQSLGSQEGLNKIKT
jgi:hypothetical protein